LKRGRKWRKGKESLDRGEGNKFLREGNRIVGGSGGKRGKGERGDSTHFQLMRKRDARDPKTKRSIKS